MRIIKKALAALAVIVAVVAGSAVPAQAGTLTCNDDSFCLYQWTNYGAGKWQTSLQNIYYSTSGGVSSCLNIGTGPKWPNGTNVTDNSGSLVYDNDGPATSVWKQFNIYVHQWSNCNPGGGVRALTQYTATFQDLTDWYYTGTSVNMYHNISSIELIPRS